MLKKFKFNKTAETNIEKWLQNKVIFCFTNILESTIELILNIKMAKVGETIMYRSMELNFLTTLITSKCQSWKSIVLRLTCKGVVGLLG